MKINGLLLIGIAAAAALFKDRPGITMTDQRDFPGPGTYAVDVTPITNPGVTNSTGIPTVTTTVVVTPAGSYIGNHAVEEDPAKQQAIAAAAAALRRAERELDAARALYQSQESAMVPYSNPASGMQPATTGYYYAGATEAQVQALAYAEQAYEDARLYLESLVKS